MYFQVLVEENLDRNEHSKIAENHFVMAMAKKHFIAWNNVLRQRGKMNRMREKLFYVWAKWAQRERRLKMMREDLEEWLRTRLKRRTVGTLAVGNGNDNDDDIHTTTFLTHPFLSFT